MPGMSIDEYMQHSGRGGGFKKSYLKSWRKNTPPAISVWLHTRASILALWRHNFSKVEVAEDRETRQSTRQVWQDRLTCWEDEETLKHNWRDRQTGERERPFRACPICLMVERVRQLVETDKLSWVEPLFRFAGDDPTKVRIYHAGGLYNAYADRKMNAVDKAELAAVPANRGGPIRPSEAWGQNLQAKLEYCFTVVNHDAPGDGVQLAIESQLLGEKMQTAIAHQVDSYRLAGEDPTLGNPVAHPYAFRWSHNPDRNVAFNLKYDCAPLPRVKLTPAIERLIREEDPPDVSGLAARFTLDTVRANLERYYVGPPGLLDWDEFFVQARALPDQPKGHVAEERAREVGTRVPDVGRPAVQLSPPPPVEDPNEEVACDDCGKVMLIRDPTCPHCHKVYEVQQAAPPPPPPPPPPAPKLPTRSEAKRMAAQAPQPTLPAVAPPAGPRAEEHDAGEPDDDIPF